MPFLGIEGVHVAVVVRDLVGQISLQFLEQKLPGLGGSKIGVPCSFPVEGKAQGFGDLRVGYMGGQVLP